MNFQKFLDQVLPDKEVQNRLRDCVCRGESIILCGTGVGKTLLQRMINAQYPTIRTISINECKGKSNPFIFNQEVLFEKGIMIEEQSFIEFFGGATK